jgi:hypothetical protein
MILFVKKNVQNVCVFEKKVVTLRDYIGMCARVCAHGAVNQ